MKEACGQAQDAEDSFLSFTFCVHFSPVFVALRCIFVVSPLVPFLSPSPPILDSTPVVVPKMILNSRCVLCVFEAGDGKNKAPKQELVGKIAHAQGSQQLRDVDDDAHTHTHIGGERTASEAAVRSVQSHTTKRHTRGWPAGRAPTVA